MNSLIPVGSIVELKDLSSYMIIGYCLTDEPKEERYDYMACNPYKGITKDIKLLKMNDGVYFIKKSDISKILYIGYHDSNLKDYEKILNDIQEKINKKKETKEKVDSKDIEEIYNSEISKIKEAYNE